jgi:hypothetical protein
MIRYKQDSYELLQYFFSFQSDYNFLPNPQNHCNLLETARLFDVGCRLYLINKNYSTIQPNASFFPSRGYENWSAEWCKSTGSSDMIIDFKDMLLGTRVKVSTRWNKIHTANWELEVLLGVTAT